MFGLQNIQKPAQELEILTWVKTQPQWPCHNWSEMLDFVDNLKVSDIKFLPSRDQETIAQHVENLLGHKDEIFASTKMSNGRMLVVIFDEFYEYLEEEVNRYKEIYDKIYTLYLELCDEI